MSNEKDNNEEFMGYVPGSNLQFEMLPEGMYDYVIHGVVGLGIQKKVFQGEEQRKPMVKIIFEIPEHKREGDGQTEVVAVNFPISSHPNSLYYKFCATVFDGFNDKEAEKMVYSSGMKELLGKVGTLKISSWEAKDGEERRSVNTKGFSALHPKVAKPIPTREPVFFNPFNPDIEVFKTKLTSWTRKQIMEALNADNFKEELKAAYEECKAEDDKKKKENDNNNNKDSAPWEGSTEAIQ